MISVSPRAQKMGYETAIVPKGLGWIELGEKAARGKPEKHHGKVCDHHVRPGPFVGLVEIEVGDPSQPAKREKEKGSRKKEEARPDQSFANKAILFVPQHLGFSP